MLFYQSVLDLERIDLPPTTQPAAGNGSGDSPATAPALPQPPLQPQPAPAQAPAVPFDPAAHVGGKGNLNDEQWTQVLRYRRDQYRRAAEAKKRQPSPAPAQR